MTDLLAATAELVSIPSPSHGEGALADHLERQLRAVPELQVTRLGDNLVARTDLGRSSRLVLAGHLDTVPPAGNESPVVQEGTLWGLGSADMKGGLAVMVDLACRLVKPRYDLTLVFYVAEEVARQHSGLLAIASQEPQLLEGVGAAIVCEPTNALVEGGCQGVVKAEVKASGQAAHVARPWTGDNAVHRLGPVIGVVANWPGRSPVIDGCAFRESLQVVGASGGSTWNVVPSEAKLQLNYRFAPDLDVEGATTALAELLAPVLGGHAQLSVVDSAPAAAPSLGHPVLAELVQASGAAPKAKLGWTDVAFFAERGVPAANFGPGDPELAHKAEEHITRGSLDRARAVLWRLLSGQDVPPPG